MTDRERLERRLDRLRSLPGYTPKALAEIKAAEQALADLDNPPAPEPEPAPVEPVLPLPVVDDPRPVRRRPLRRG